MEKKKDDSLKEVKEGFEEMASVLEEIFGKASKKGSSKDPAGEEIPKEGLSVLREHLKTGNPQLKKAVAGFMVNFYLKDLTIEELEYFLHSTDLDIKVSVAIEILESRAKQMNRYMYKRIADIDDPRVRGKIDEYFFFISKKE